MEDLGPVSIRFEEEQLRERLSTLPQLAAVAFAAACAARLENTARGLTTAEDLEILLLRTMDAVIAYLGSGSPFDTLAAERDLLVAMPDEDANPDCLRRLRRTQRQRRSTC